MRKLASPPEMNGEISHTVRNGVLLVTLTGPVTIAAIADYVFERLDLWQKHTRILWDLRNLVTSRNGSSSLREVRTTFEKVLQLRAGGWSALVVQDQNGLGLTRQLISHLELNQVAIRLKSFTSMERAEDWLVGGI